MNLVISSFLDLSTHAYFSYRRVFKKGSFYKPLDISGKSWDWGSIPFLRASKLEMSRSGILVKLLLTKT